MHSKFNYVLMSKKDLRGLSSAVRNSASGSVIPSLIKGKDQNNSRLDRIYKL